jgi:hypothetical protein
MRGFHIPEHSRRATPGFIALLSLAGILLWSGGIPLAHAAPPYTTDLSLSAPSCVGPASSITLSAQLTNSSNSANIGSETITFYVSINGGSQNSIGTSSTSGSGIASLTYAVPSALGNSYAFQAKFGGDATYSASNSNTVIAKSAYVSGWGTIASGLTATLNGCPSNWALLSPSVFTAAPSENPRANFTYSSTNLQSLDLDTISFYTPSGGFNYGYTFNSTVKATVDSYTIKDSRQFSNGFFGLGQSQTRTVSVIFPNGTEKSYNANSNYADRLRIFLFHNAEDQLQFGYSFTPYPTTSLDVNYTRPPTTWNVGTTFNPTVTFFVSFNSNGISNQTISLRLNSFAQGSGASSSYTTVLGELSMISGAPTGTSNGLGTLFGAVGQFFANGIASIQSALSGFLNFLTPWGFLRSIGLGWLVDAFSYFVSLFLGLIEIVIATLPYLGIVLVIIHLYYIIRFDFAGLFGFWFTIYNVVSVVADAIFNFVQIIVDLTQSLSGGGGAVVAAAA